MYTTPRTGVLDVREDGGAGGRLELLVARVLPHGVQQTLDHRLS